MSKAKNQIDVYESPLSDTIIKSFTNVDDLLEWNKLHNVSADQIAVNDLIILGWDELDMFLN